MRIAAYNEIDFLNIFSEEGTLLQVERATANTRHPFCNFTTGTRKTLHVDPKSNKNLKYEVFNFFKRQYSANLMTVCIIHNADLQKIEEIAVGKFYSTMQFFENVFFTF